jgi:hypothetical protein
MLQAAAMAGRRMFFIERWQVPKMEIAAKQRFSVAEELEGTCALEARMPGNESRRRPRFYLRVRPWVKAFSARPL